MATITKIQWTDHTFHPWRGCTRVIASEAYWRQPIAWNRQADKEGRRHRVCCASLADVFEERQELNHPRARLLSLIHRTPHLDWQLLTRRADGILARLRDVAFLGETDHQEINDGACLAHQWLHGSVMPNIWIMASVEDQQRADERIPQLVATPARVRFLSCEPLLGPINLNLNLLGERVAWVIVGGESGSSARPCDIRWISEIVTQCQQAGVACFVKQLGTHPCNGPPLPFGFASKLKLRNRKGGDISEFPGFLQVRQFPEVAM